MSADTRQELQCTREQNMDSVNPLITLNSIGIVYEKFDMFQGEIHTEGFKSIILKLASPPKVVYEVIFKVIKYHSSSFGIKSCVLDDISN